MWEYYQSIRNASIYYIDASKYKMTIDNLYKNRIYKLRVQAWSLGGEGKYSSPEKEFRFGKIVFIIADMIIEFSLFQITMDVY